MKIFHSGEEILEMAVILEERGFEFYTTYKENAKDDKIKELFQYLADEEANHKKTFQEFLDNLSKKEFTLTYSDEEVLQYFSAIVDARVFDNPDFAIQLAKDTKDELEAVNLAIGFEKDSIVFYEGLMGLVNEKSKNTVTKIIEEEKKHIQNLSKIRHELK